jgi:PAS domain S-box-containing protein
MKARKSPASTKPNVSVADAKLRHRAEASLHSRRNGQRSRARIPKSEADAQRLLHELQVHQVELEMQNMELQEARDRMETLVEKYTDLYDFAPVGYFSLDEQGRILESNLRGAALLGVDRSRLINRRLPVAPTSQVVFLAFLKRVFAGKGRQVCEAALLKEKGANFWASFHGTIALSIGGPQKWCRVAVSDITSLKQAEEAERRVEILAVANRELRREIVRRQAVEEALKKSEQHQSALLDRSRQMQEQLRHLSHQILQAQEEERKRISRELHDEIAQTLTGINVRLANLKAGAVSDGKELQKKITATQRLVEKSVQIVHRFARELRPSVLDDLGLIPALHSFVKTFAERTHLCIRLRIFAGVEQLDSAKRTVLYRVAQEALTNIARHAHATEVDLCIEKLPNAVSMQVKDNGKSFPVERMLHAKKHNRLGLLGMRERVEMVGGTFTVESTPGVGTTVEARIPFRHHGGKNIKPSARNKS